MHVVAGHRARGRGPSQFQDHVFWLDGQVRRRGGDLRGCRRGGEQAKRTEQQRSGSNHQAGGSSEQAGNAQQQRQQVAAETSPTSGTRVSPGPGTCC